MDLLGGVEPVTAVRYFQPDYSQAGISTVVLIKMARTNICNCCLAGGCYSTTWLKLFEQSADEGFSTAFSHKEKIANCTDRRRSDCHDEPS